MENKQKSEDCPIGVIVGRFMVHELHAAHKDLINQVLSKHKKVIIFLGCSRIIGTRENPLDFTTRKKMLQAAYPDTVIIPLPDNRYDEVWSKNLDARVREVYPMGNVLLYGGRDSFIPHYTGIFKTHELEQTIYISGTEIRKEVSEQIKSSPEWRAGCIYNSYNRYPISFQTVDIACFKGDQLILCKKPGEKNYRFVGGFVDPTDSSLEAAAKREWSEETGGNAEVGPMKYIGSFRVDDWRYKNGRDKIMTALFTCDFSFGRLDPSDDISELIWMSMSGIVKDGNIESVFVPEHVPLALALIAQYKTK